MLRHYYRLVSSFGPLEEAQAQRKMDGSQLRGGERKEREIERQNEREKVKATFEKRKASAGVREVPEGMF